MLIRFSGREFDSRHLHQNPLATVVIFVYFLSVISRGRTSAEDPESRSAWRHRWLGLLHRVGTESKWDSIVNLRFFNLMTPLGLGYDLVQWLLEEDKDEDSDCEI